MPSLNDADTMAKDLAPARILTARRISFTAYSGKARLIDVPPSTGFTPAFPTLLGRKTFGSSQEVSPTSVSAICRSYILYSTAIMSKPLLRTSQDSLLHPRKYTKLLIASLRW